MVTLESLIMYIEEKNGLKISNSYKIFLTNFMKLSKPINFECLLKNKVQSLCLDTLYNIIDFTQMIALRNNYPDLLENKVAFIGGFIGGESLCIGVGNKNFGKIYFSETDLNEFIEIAPDFENFYFLLNMPISS